ncbi:MAG TPA: LppX_LprAFG lipoprotein [Anaerolineae bacterium]|nr:LppX_LprAFG lipoprotein [Anaerolineae bacterium]
MSRFFIGLLGVSLAILSACSPPPPELPPDEVVQRAANAMLDQSALHFTIAIEGKPVTINSALGLSLRSAEGRFVRPDRMGVHLKIVASLAAIEADMIALGEEQYLTNFLTQAWEPLPAEFGFNPAVLFHPEFGLEQTLAGGLDGAANAGVESIDGAQVYRVRGSLDGARLQFMSGGLISTGRVDVDVWVDAQTFVVRRTVLVDATTDSEQPSTWILTFSKFGEPASIEKPIE